VGTVKGYLQLWKGPSVQLQPLISKKKGIDSLYFNESFYFIGSRDGKINIITKKFKEGNW